MDEVIKAAKPEDVRKAKEAAGEKTEGAAPKAAPRFIGDGPKETLLKLNYPLEWDGREFHQLTFQPMRGKSFSELKTLVAMGVSEDVAMIHLVTGAPVEVVNALHADDYIDATEMSQNFIPSRFLEKTPSESETGQNTQQ